MSGIGMNVYRVRFGVGGREVRLVVAHDHANAQFVFSKWVHASGREFPCSLVDSITVIERLDEELATCDKEATA